MAQHHILSPAPAAEAAPPTQLPTEINAMVIGAALFYLWWTMNLKREAKKEQERIEGLRARGLLGEEKY
ncbi:hypothetical protein H2199_000839 [Coniosporium tulheliwenetii]|uniref:Uncharacterized protein n=1 Tax=Coniosporium tulheliwenetii TaxID=3383036 RepID=A0ACC2ZMV2_9PEZI|nr:hypothetical protein H2199_000839 [Cladosporium sp. JES 115]